MQIGKDVRGSLAEGYTASTQFFLLASLVFACCSLLCTPKRRGWDGDACALRENQFNQRGLPQRQAQQRLPGAEPRKRCTLESQQQAQPQPDQGSPPSLWLSAGW